MTDHEPEKAVSSETDEALQRPVLYLDRNAIMRLGANGDLQIKTTRGWHSTDRFGPLLLELSTSPRSYSEAVQIISQRATGQAELQEMLTVVQALRERGVLVGIPLDTGTSRPRHRYYSASAHIAMLNDAERTDRFVEAIRAVVHPGDVVVDLGAGTGVLSLAAAKAGAAKVYAIEVSDDVRLARELCSEYIDNGTVEVLRKWSTSTSLPHRADVFVSEMVGHDPLGEQILELTMDARRRLLKPDARLIPRRLKVMALPLTVPKDRLGEHRFTEQTVAGLARRLGDEFLSLNRLDRDQWQCFYVKPQNAREWPLLAEPGLLADIDLAEVDSASPTLTASCTMATGGDLNGIMIVFEIDLSDGVTLSTHPGTASATNHWRNPVWCVVKGRQISAGDTVDITYRRIGGRSELSCR